MTLTSLTTRRDLNWPNIAANTTTDLGMIAHYDGSKRLMQDWATRGHIACVDYWKRTRIIHINGNGWRDVGYAYFICPDGGILEGRGVNRVQAAELPTPGKIQQGNTRYVAVTFGTGPGQVPTDAAIEGWHKLRDWLVTEHKVAPPVFGHRDFTNTDCPGDVIYGMIRNGTLTNRTTSVPPTSGDLVSSLPTLREGMSGPDVLTIRALLFQRFLSEDFQPGVVPPESVGNLFFWLREQRFTDDLTQDVIDYQKWKFPGDPSQWDGIVGPITWRALCRV